MSYIKAIPTVLSKTANYTVSTNDGDNVQVNVSASGGAVTIVFYAASGNAGKIITVKKTDSSANAVTLDGNASETLDGATTLTLSAQHDSATLVCDGTNWIKASAMGAGAIPISGMAAGDDIYASSSTQLAAGARQLRQSFRGLTLRTHPDVDVAASRVYLDHADEIVLNDGTRAADWNDLAADITASGAGGLDTGSEGASRWYEIHAIRKSSDGTKNLLLHRAKNYALDQSQTTQNNNYYLRYDTNNQKVSQGFTPSVTGSLPFVDWYLKKVGSPTGQFYFTVEADSGGKPSGTPLATSDKIDVSLLATSYQWVRAIFRSPVSLTSGTLYHVVIYGTSTLSTTNYVDTAMASSSLYAGGTSYAYDGAAWIALGAGWDYVFKTYITQNDTAVTMPSGYDQYAHIGWVYNNSGSNFNAFAAVDKRVRLSVPGTSGDLAAGTPVTLIDFSSVIPPVPVTLTVNLAPQGAAGMLIKVGPVPDGLSSSLNSSLSSLAFVSWATASDRSYGIGLVDFNTEAQAFYMFHNGASAARVYGVGFSW